MPLLSQAATSTQPVQQVVSPPSGINPSSDAVQMAFIPVPASGIAPSPAPGQWNTAYWEVDSGPVYWASILVGPANGGLVLTAGVYQIFVKVVDNPAVPVLPGWLLSIT